MPYPSDLWMQTDRHTDLGVSLLPDGFIVVAICTQDGYDSVIVDDEQAERIIDSLRGAIDAFAPSASATPAPSASPDAPPPSTNPEAM